MWRTITLALLTLCVATAVHAAVGSELGVALDVSPATTLPGIPVALRVTFTNSGSTPASLPPHVVLLAKVNGSDPFVVRFDGFRTKVPMGVLREDQIPAHGTAVGEARTEGVLTEPGWFIDTRLNQPGRFELQLIIGDFAGDVLQAPEEGIRSTPAVLQVNEPTGIDLKIWKEMLTVGNGEWEPRKIFTPGGEALARRVLSEWPYSQYAGWFAATGISERASESADALRAWLSQASRDQYTEWRQLRLALFDDGGARETTRLPHNEILRYLHSARALLATLKSSTDQDIAARANSQLVRIAALSDLEQQ